MDVTSNPKKTRRKKSRGGRVAADITMADLEKWFHLPSDAAATQLGISGTLLKRVCRRLGIPKWPYRKITKAEKRAKYEEEGIPKPQPEADLEPSSMEQEDQPGTISQAWSRQNYPALVPDIPPVTTARDWQPSNQPLHSSGPSTSTDPGHELWDLLHAAGMDISKLSSRNAAGPQSQQQWPSRPVAAYASPQPTAGTTQGTLPSPGAEDHGPRPTTDWVTFSNRGYQYQAGPSGGPSHQPPQNKGWFQWPGFDASTYAIDITGFTASLSARAQEPAVDARQSGGASLIKPKPIRGFGPMSREVPNTWQQGFSKGLATDFMEVTGANCNQNVNIQFDDDQIPQHPAGHAGITPLLELAAQLIKTEGSEQQQQQPNSQSMKVILAKALADQGLMDGAAPGGKVTILASFFKELANALDVNQPAVGTE